jgi:hypothetical protein
MSKSAKVHSGPILPLVDAEITAVEGRLAQLEAARGEVVLAALADGGDPAAVERLDAEVRGLQAKLHNLHAAAWAAHERDVRARADERARRQVYCWEAFKTGLEARDAAIARYCDAAAKLAAAFHDINELSGGLEILLPEGTRLPAGFTFYSGDVMVNGTSHPAPLEHLCAFELYRHSNITRPGQHGAELPGAKPFNMSTLYNSAAIEPWVDATARVSNFLADAVLRQIEQQREIDLEAIADVMRERKVA